MGQDEKPAKPKNGEPGEPRVAEDSKRRRERIRLLEAVLFFVAVVAFVKLAIHVAYLL